MARQEQPYTEQIMHKTKKWGIFTALKLIARTLKADWSYNRGDYETAMRHFRHMAVKWNIPHAQFNMGIMHERGEGVPENHAEAARWFRLAAEQGYAEAQYCLATMYESGEGVAWGYEEAIKWYEHAARQGHAMSILRLEIETDLVYGQINNGGISYP
ncbi:MAG: sel1 repeat family protein [Rhodobacteraceae bacterium]|nr:sel1 repeat family protein [Paracoccaceae bacterium]